MKELGFTNGDCSGAHSPLAACVPANGKAGACMDERSGAGNFWASEFPVGEICKAGLVAELGGDVAESPPMMPPGAETPEEGAVPLAEMRPPVGTEVELIKCGGMLNTRGACGTETRSPKPGPPLIPPSPFKPLPPGVFDAGADDDDDACNEVEPPESPWSKSPKPPATSSFDFNLPVRSWNVGTSRAGDTEKLTSRMCPSRLGGVSDAGIAGGDIPAKGKCGDIPLMPGDNSPMGIRGELLPCGERVVDALDCANPSTLFFNTPRRLALTAETDE